MYELKIPFLILKLVLGFGKGKQESFDQQGVSCGNFLYVNGNINYKSVCQLYCTSEKNNSYFKFIFLLTWLSAHDSKRQMHCKQLLDFN